MSEDCLRAEALAGVSFRHRNQSQMLLVTSCTALQLQPSAVFSHVRVRRQDDAHNQSTCCLWMDAAYLNKDTSEDVHRGDPSITQQYGYEGMHSFYLNCAERLHPHMVWNMPTSFAAFWPLAPLSSKQRLREQARSWQTLVLTTAPITDGCC